MIIKTVDGVEYNDKKQRFLTTNPWVLKQLGFDIKVLKVDDTVMTDAFFDQISRHCYDYYYSFKRPEDLEKAEYILHSTVKNVTAIRDAMVAHIEYALFSSGNLVKLKNAINESTGTTVEYKLLREDFVVADETRQILDRNKLLYRDRLNYFTIPESE